MEKLLEKSDINTMKTLTNTWSVIKKKLRTGWEADAEPEVNIAPTRESLTDLVSVLPPKSLTDYCSPHS